ncbi:unnamed protein product [Rotaria sordida]|uniref:Nucleoside diphosphate kinase-like domain-containing protein n=1 Tax=Rotaria sordida TaxID=392033 RepID=A0A814DUX5_9BILA|nr:unnamed protein product [Rotaria sordida]
MARRRQEIALQAEIETQEEWNEAINKDGLTVVDVYQQWAGPFVDIYQAYGGPCKAMEPKFRTIKNTLGDAILNFAIAKADTIDSLEKHRGRCEPCFLFYASGVLVDAVIGANAPELQRKIMLNLEEEKRILKEGGERREFIFQQIDQDEDEEVDPRLQRHRSSSVANAITSQQYTLAVIRPDAYADGKVDEIVETITQNGFKILVQEEHHLNEHDARELHRYKMNQEGYEEHIARMTSGPSVVLLLQKTDAKASTVDDLRELVNSDELLKTNVDYTPSTDNIHDELMLLLPHIARRPRTPEENLERTLAIIRPSALKLYKDAIIDRIRDSGFEVTRTLEIQLTRQQVEEFYASKKNEPYYEDIIQEMTSGPSLALYLTKKDAIQGFHALLGPAEKNKIKEATGTFRHDFDIVDAKINSLHAPRTRTEANRHLQFFFPEERILVILKPNLSDQQRSEIVAAFKKAGFFIMTRKMEKLTSEQVAQLQQSHQGKDYYNELLNYMTSGPSELFVLVKENASQSWQQLVGPDDPAKAVESAPTSLRALYGKDLVHNAIDVSMDVEQAKNDVHLIFGDLDREEA